MSTLLKIFLVLFAAFLTYRSYDLVVQLMDTSPGAHDLTENLILAFLLSLFITGVFALPGFALPTSRAFGDSYYHIRNQRGLTTLYRLLGVEYFRRSLLVFFWGLKKNRKRYFDGTRSGLANLDYQSRQSEFGHLMAFVVICAVSVPLLIQGHVDLVALTQGFNLIGNLYPVILQRHHRMRLSRLRGL